MITVKEKSQQVPALLCQLLSPFSSKKLASDVLDTLLHDEVMLDLTIELANRHFLIPTLYRQLCDHGLDHRLSHELREFMDTMTEFMAERNRTLIEQTKEIIAETNKQGHTPLLMKGASTLFSDVYPDVGIRFMSDLDILFPENQALDALGTLKKINYTVPNKYQHWQAYNDENKLPRGQHFAPVYREGAACAVEVHLRPFIPYYNEYMTCESVFAGGTEINGLKSEGYSAVRMSPIDEIIHCFVHSELSHRNYDYKAFDLRQMDYFIRLIYRYQHEVSWSDIHKRIPSLEGKAVFCYFINALNRLFGVSFPVEEGRVSEQALEMNYQQSLASCFPRYHRTWKVKRFIAEYSKILSKKTLSSLYDVGDSMSLSKARMRRIGVLTLKYRHPLKLIGRIQNSMHRK